MLRLTIFKDVTTEIILSDNLNFEYNQEVYLFDTISIKDGQILTQNYKLDTDSLGEKDIEIIYKDSNNIFKRKYNYKINVVDTTAPILTIPKNIYIDIESENKDILSKITFAGDNETRKLNYSIEGTYDLNTIGNYDIKVIAKDNSNNKVEKDTTLHIYKNDSTQTDSSSNNQEENRGIELSYFINNYKDNNEIGVDLSSYQTVDDFNKLKEAGIEFVMLRLGWGPNSDLTFNTDKNFEDFYTRAKEANLKVGVYYFSYATTLDEVDLEVNYVLDSLKDKDIDFYVSYDWENWRLFKDCNMNFSDLNKMAKKFMDRLKEKGYQVMNYGSKTYLELIWDLDEYDTWLAQYNDEVTYSKKFKIWQISEQGIVDGINGLVDIDILIK